MAAGTLAEILSPATLARIDNYQLLARIVVEGFFSGLHRSVYHGFGSEFLQYRDYSPGDDLKYLDWKVFARHDRFYTKVFEEETNMNCTLVLDASASMDFRGQRAPCTKLHYASMIAACLAYLAFRQGDNVALYAYGSDLLAAIPAGRRQGHLPRILGQLQTLRASGSAEHERHLGYVGETLRRRGLTILISDFLEAEERVAPLLKRFRFSGNDCIVVQVLDPDEMDLPYRVTTRFIDSETGAQIVTSPASIRQEYAAAMAAFQDNMRRLAHDIQADFLPCATSAGVGTILAAYLHRRGAAY